jgi:Zn-finger nucleic acid-binding protein
MQCPNCPTTTLLMSERRGVEIDYCPQCRGVWLDRGELDKLIERANQEADATAPAQPMREAGRRGDDARRGDDRHRADDLYRDDARHRHRRKKSLWGEIFDFD